MNKIIIVFFLAIFSTNFCFAITPVYKKVAKRVDNRLELDLPWWAFSLAWENKNDISFWLKSVPDEDRNKEEYIVIPRNGLVIPVNQLARIPARYSFLTDGRDENYNQYLETGVAKFSLDTEYGGFWNVVIFWHSSFWKDKPWRYKTHFQKIIELDGWDEIWIFKKIVDGSYKRFIYKTYKSYNTPATDLWVLENKKTSKKLTLFTCTPIWWIAWRWIIEAEYDESSPKKNIWVHYNNLIWELIRKIEWKPNKKRIIVSLLKKIQIYRKIITKKEEWKNKEFLNDLMYTLEDELNRIY